jgi:hypothetical protein
MGVSLSPEFQTAVVGLANLWLAQGRKPGLVDPD